MSSFEISVLIWLLFSSFVSLKDGGSFCHLLLFFFCHLYFFIISSACLMVGDNAEAERALWDHMAQREPEVFVPRGPAPERILLDIHRRWSAAPTSSTPLDILVPPTVTVASGNLVMGVHPGLLTVAAPLKGGLLIVKIVNYN